MEEGHVTAEITVIEPLGKESYVDLSVGDLEFLAIIGSRYPVESGQEIDLTFNMDRVHLFEKEGEALSVFTPRKETASVN